MGQLQPRLNKEEGYTEYDTQIGADIDKSLRIILDAPDDLREQELSRIYKNASRFGSFKEQFTMDDVRNRYNELINEQREPKAFGGIAGRAILKLMSKHKDNIEVKKLSKEIEKERKNLDKLEDKMIDQRDSYTGDTYVDEIGFDNPRNQEDWEYISGSIEELEDNLEGKLLELEGVGMYNPPREEFVTGGLVTLIKEALQARKKAEREEDYDALTASIPEQEDKIADRLAEIAEKNKIYSKKSKAFFPHKRSPDSYVVSDELHNRREELKNKSLLSTGTVSPFGLMIGALSKKGLDYETMPESEYKRITNMVGSIADEVNKEIEMDRRNFYQGGSMSDKNTWAKTPIEKRTMYQEGGDIDSQMAGMMEGPTHTMPDGTVMPGATHGEYEQMIGEEELIPDEQMEDNYVDFIVGESLSQEDEDYLMVTLNEDERLSMIFDQVVEKASEFSGSGSVEGPGSGVSDSIPARLSDGEFVITSKATEEIGSDTLQSMMEQAEEASDVRQMRQLGGYIQEDEENSNIKMASQPKVTGQHLMGDQLQDRENQKNMMMLNPRNTLLARRP